MITILGIPSPEDLSDLQEENSESGHAMSWSERKENCKTKVTCLQTALRVLEITGAEWEVPSGVSTVLSHISAGDTSVLP